MNFLSPSMFGLALGLLLPCASCTPVAVQRQPEGMTSKGEAQPAQAKPSAERVGGRPLREVAYNVSQTDEGVRVRVTSPSYRSTIDIKGKMEGSMRAAHPALWFSSGPSKRLIEVLAETNVNLDGPVERVIKKYIAMEMNHIERALGTIVPVRSETLRAPSGATSVLWGFEMPVQEAKPDVVPIRWRVFVTTVSGDHVFGIAAALDAQDDKKSAVELLKASLTTLKTEHLNSEVVASLPANCGVAGLASQDAANRLSDACKRRVPGACSCVSLLYMKRKDSDSVQLALHALSFGCENNESSSCGTAAILLGDRPEAKVFRDKACQLGQQQFCEKPGK